MGKDKGKHNHAHRNPGNSARPSDPPSKATTLSIPAPLSVRLETTSEDNKRYSNDYDQRERQVRSANRLNWITVIGVVVGIASVIGLLISVVQSTKAMQIDERAWLGIAYANPIDLEHPQIRIKLQNFGKTPALHIIERAQWKVVSVGQTFDPSVLVSQTKPVSAMRVLAPGIPGDIGQQLPTPNAQEAADVISGKTVLYIFGSMTYDDIFQHEHFLHFCLKFNPGTPAGFSGDHPYNDAN
jgi:hypothetical protein